MTVSSVNKPTFKNCAVPLFRVRIRFSTIATIRQNRRGVVSLWTSLPALLPPYLKTRQHSCCLPMWQDMSGGASLLGLVPPLKKNGKPHPCFSPIGQNEKELYGGGLPIRKNRGGVIGEWASLED